MKQHLRQKYLSAISADVAILSLYAHSNITAVREYICLHVRTLIFVHAAILVLPLQIWMFYKY